MMIANDVAKSEISDRDLQQGELTLNYFALIQFLKHKNNDVLDIQPSPLQTMS